MHYAAIEELWEVGFLALANSEEESDKCMVFRPGHFLFHQGTSDSGCTRDLITGEIFERHRVIFTVSTSIASVATAWVGYSIRMYHQSRVENRLESIEQALKEHAQLGKTEIKKMVNSGSTAASLATAGTTFLVGYGLGWRGGRWQARRQFRKEQMKLLGQWKPKRWQFLAGIKPKGLQLLVGIKPKSWQLQFLPLTKLRGDAKTIKSSENIQKNVLTTKSSTATGTQPSCAAPGSSLHNKDEDSGGACKSMVEKQDYPCEEHTVTTDDGYVLSLQRIPFDNTSRSSSHRQPVLLQHGLLMNAVSWLLAPPTQSLPCLIADNDFDVWISSSRGTEKNRGHKTLPADSPVTLNTELFA